MTVRRELGVAVAQPLVVPAAIDHNLAMMEPLVHEAARQGAQVVLFSECGVNGYDLDNRSIGVAMSQSDARLDRIASMSMRHRTAIVAGFYENFQGTIHNSALVFFPDGRRVLQRKHNIIEHEKDETPTQPGPRQRVLFEIGGLTCAILICADGGMPNIWEELSAQGCELVLCPTAGLGWMQWGYSQAQVDDEKSRSEYLQKNQTVCYPAHAVERAIQLQMSMAASNQLGLVREMNYYQPGHSVIVDMTGELVAVLPGKFCYDHVRRPEVAVGIVHGRAK